MSTVNFFAQAGAGGLPQPPDTQGLMSDLMPILTVVGVILAVGLLLFLVVYYIKRGRDASDGGSGHHHHRHRKRLRTHRPRNPTLAETGGLPPIRSDDGSRPS